MEILLIIGIGIGLAIGIFTNRIFTKQKENQKINEQSTVLINQIKQVCKLITVEGDFSEIIAHIDQKPMLFKLVQLEKKALIIVKAKVMVGFDLSEISINIEPKNKKITLSKFPSAQILSLDTDIEYYDIKKGIINKFSETDLNLLTQKAKEHIRNKTKESGLLAAAESQAHETILLLKNFINASNWEVITEGFKQLDMKHTSKLEPPKTAQK